MIRPLTPAEYDAWRPALVALLSRQRGARADAMVKDLDVDAVGQQLLAVPGGHAWIRLRTDHRDASVFALDSTEIPAALTELEQHVRAAGAERFSVNAFAQESELDDLLVARGYQLSATQMRLTPLETTPSEVVLRPINEAERAAFLEGNSQDYADDQVRVGMGLRELLEPAAEAQLAELLAKDTTTLLTATLDGSAVGVLWLEITPPDAYVYDVIVDPAHRGRGLGRATMNAGATYCLERGATTLGLNVFGFNDLARGLYLSLGYVPTEQLRTLWF